jgi:hypothetical protein
MTIEGVVIRTANQQKKMNQELVRALHGANKNSKGIPVVYQYLHNPNEPLIVDSDNTMGYVYNVRRNHRGDVIGDVEIMQLLRIAVNWQGVIDNIAASPKQEQNNQYTVDAFIVYDIAAKARIDKKREEQKLVHPMGVNRLAVAGEIPFMPSADDNSFIKEASEKLTEEYKNCFAKQTDNQMTTSEGGTEDE